MRFGQSAADADTLTRARPLATSTESVSCHTEENLGVDQWYKSMSRSPRMSAHQIQEHDVSVWGNAFPLSGAGAPHAEMATLRCSARLQPTRNLVLTAQPPRYSWGFRNS